MVPTLLSMIFSTLLTDSFHDVNIGFSLRYQYDGKLFPLQILQGKKTKPKCKMTSSVTSCCRLLCTYCWQPVQNAEKYGYILCSPRRPCPYNKHKENQGHVTTPFAAPYTQPTITVGGQKLELANKFTYLGSTLSRTVTISEEITYRMVCASVAIGRLHTSVLE